MKLVAYEFKIDQFQRSFPLPLNFVVLSAQLREDASDGSLTIRVFGEEVREGTPLIAASIYIIHTGDLAPRCYTYKCFLGHDTHLYTQGD